MTFFINPPYISAFIVFQKDENAKYLLLRRCGKYLTGTWQMVTGSILEGETAPQAALREIQEETGLMPKEIYSADAVETFYMKSCDKIVFVPAFVAFVETMNVIMSPLEHDAFEWLTYEAAKDRLIWSEQRRVLSHIHETCVLKKPHDLLKISL